MSIASACTHFKYYTNSFLQLYLFVIKNIALFINNHNHFIIGKKTSLLEIATSQIVILHKEELSERTISSRMECSKSAVNNAIVNFKNFGIYGDKKRSGRPRVTSPREDHLIRRECEQQDSSSCHLELP